ncbi:MAG: type III-B CRISPR module RAMP protein Cmr6 [Deltaproteobacteria bacterium]|nr:type III-B CRISPR module RAMP protein Cmr6 [Deltaproteobacteria bacterium]MBW1920177.1 type III-B CRISPR module RAMP protein Cmr6 [Deltaproteobacteria bacterium]MBW1934821.1 type III-B CRISPR module RAMP protein Cmr6 [Deltaproteobacteria bacterium]MBW1979090.1 type III-B CRISPR module RAMP protein Cmr6 [Deltaproteobacteria bacterium]MBW2045734.1 type III-B CRISPR module RAMP protein Cmr6 [Deltaproteobacteria bacterium]
MFYPFGSKQLQEAAGSFEKGNFGLWFNKLIPLNTPDMCKPCNHNGDMNEAVHYHKAKYDSMKKNRKLAELLEQKHKDQNRFCKSFEKAGYATIYFTAELKSPLVTGIGQTHPNEVGMVFDHTLGIPYIPASGVKGIVRFAHTLGLIDKGDPSFIAQDNNGEYIDETNANTLIPDIFGGDEKTEKKEKKETTKLRGKVVFLDAYPVNVPKLHVDIMDPHYSKYYNEGEPPADYLSPNPIKFLTVKPGTRFIFRAIVPKDSDCNLENQVRVAFKNALEIEGMGAKTAVGYGRFKVLSGASSDKQGKQIGKPHSEGHEEGTAPSYSEQLEVWEKAYLSWNPGNQTLTAIWQEKNKRAFIMGKEKVHEFVPALLHKRLFGKKKRKTPIARVMVEPAGNAFRIVKVEEVE